MKKIIKNIPNFLTLLNLTSGLLSIQFVISYYSSNNDTHFLVYSSIFILLASVFDFLDGFAARLLKAYSELGKQLDSFADMVSFGIAPSVIVFYWLQYYYNNFFVATISFLIAICSVLRLARFNLAKENKNFFEGLPTPASAIFFASINLSLLLIEKQDNFFKIFYTKEFLLILTVLISFLMISKIKIFTLKFENLKLLNNWHRFTLLFFTIIFIALFWLWGIVFSILFYIILAVFYRRVL